MRSGVCALTYLKYSTLFMVFYYEEIAGQICPGPARLLSHLRVGETETGAQRRNGETLKIHGDNDKCPDKRTSNREDKEQ